MAAVLIGYPLSIGPFLWLSDRVFWAVAIFDPVYDPLRWSMSRTDATDGALNAYCFFRRTTAIPGLD